MNNGKLILALLLKGKNNFTRTLKYFYPNNEPFALKGTRKNQLRICLFKKH